MEEKLVVPVTNFDTKESTYARSLCDEKTLLNLTVNLWSPTRGHGGVLTTGSRNSLEHIPVFLF